MDNEVRDPGLRHAGEPGDEPGSATSTTDSGTISAAVAATPPSRANPTRFVAAALADAPADDLPRTATDPVCGMSVDPARGCAYPHATDGQTYYFCCAGCREKFEGGPGSLSGVRIGRLGGIR